MTQETTKETKTKKAAKIAKRIPLLPLGFVFETVGLVLDNVGRCIRGTGYGSLVVADKCYDLAEVEHSATGERALYGGLAAQILELYPDQAETPRQLAFAICKYVGSKRTMDIMAEDGIDGSVAKAAPILLNLVFEGRKAEAEQERKDQAEAEAKKEAKKEAKLAKQAAKKVKAQAAEKEAREKLAAEKSAECKEEPPAPLLDVPAPAATSPVV